MKNKKTNDKILMTILLTMTDMQEEGVSNDTINRMNRILGDNFKKVSGYTYCSIEKGLKYFYDNKNEPSTSFISLDFMVLNDKLRNSEI